jgi:hypothetical protein
LKLPGLHCIDTATGPTDGQDAHRSSVFGFAASVIEACSGSGRSKKRLRRPRVAKVTSDAARCEGAHCHSPIPQGRRKTCGNKEEGERVAFQPKLLLPRSDVTATPSLALFLLVSWTSSKNLDKSSNTYCIVILVVSTDRHKKVQSTDVALLGEMFMQRRHSCPGRSNGGCFGPPFSRPLLASAMVSPSPFRMSIWASLGTSRFKTCIRFLWSVGSQSH